MRQWYLQDELHSSAGGQVCVAVPYLAISCDREKTFENGSSGNVDPRSCLSSIVGDRPMRNPNVYFAYGGDILGKFLFDLFRWHMESSVSCSPITAWLRMSFFLWVLPLLRSFAERGLEYNKRKFNHGILWTVLCIARWQKSIVWREGNNWLRLIAPDLRSPLSNFW